MHAMAIFYFYKNPPNLIQTIKYILIIDSYNMVVIFQNESCETMSQDRGETTTVSLRTEGESYKPKDYLKRTQCQLKRSTPAYLTQVNLLSGFNLT